MGPFRAISIYDEFILFTVWAGQAFQEQDCLSFIHYEFNATLWFSNVHDNSSLGRCNPAVPVCFMQGLSRLCLPLFSIKLNIKLLFFCFCFVFSSAFSKVHSKIKECWVHNMKLRCFSWRNMYAKPFFFCQCLRFLLCAFVCVRVCVNHEAQNKRMPCKRWQASE